MKNKALHFNLAWRVDKNPNNMWAWVLITKYRSLNINATTRSIIYRTALALLSLNSLTGNLSSAPNSFSSPTFQTSSVVVFANLLYLTSTEILDIVDCFLSFHAIKEFPIFTTYPFTYFLLRRHVAQSTSHYAEIVLSVLLDNNIPCPKFFLM